MKDCDLIREFLSEYMDGTLDEDKKQRVQVHLSECQDCRHQLQKLQEISAEIKNIKKVQPPQDFLERLHQRIEQRESLDGFLARLLKSSQVKVYITASVTFLFVFALYRVVNQYQYSMQARIEEGVVIEKPSVETSRKEEIPEVYVQDFEDAGRVEYSESERLVMKGYEDKKTGVSLDEYTEYAEPQSGLALKEESHVDSYTAVASRESRQKQYARVYPLEKASARNVVTIAVTDIPLARERVKEMLAALNIEIVSPAQMGVETEGEIDDDFFVLNVIVPPGKIDSLMEELNNLNVGKVIVSPDLPESLKQQSNTLTIYFEQGQ